MAQHSKYRVSLYPPHPSFSVTSSLRLVLDRARLGVLVLQRPMSFVGSGGIGPYSNSMDKNLKSPIQQLSYKMRTKLRSHCEVRQKDKGRAQRLYHINLLKPQTDMVPHINKLLDQLHVAHISLTLDITRDIGRSPP